MLRREKGAELAKNIVAERERVIELGEHAPDTPSPAAVRVFRDRLRRKARKVILDRGNLRVKIGDLARRRERQLVEPACIHRVDRERRQPQTWKGSRTIGSVERSFEHRYDIVRFDQVQDGGYFADERRCEVSNLASMREAVQAPIRERHHLSLPAWAAEVAPWSPERRASALPREAVPILPRKPWLRQCRNCAGALTPLRVGSGEPRARESCLKHELYCPLLR